MKCLDLFCGAGGCSVGYHRAGFDVVGVDIRPQPRYPFHFIQADALEYAAAHGHEYDLIHASPPCQAYTSMRFVTGKEYPRLIEEARAVLSATGRPYVIENVPGAPLENPIMLCGVMFGLMVFRHRLFETRPFILSPCHLPHGDRRAAKQGRRPRVGQYMTVTGNFSGQEYARRAMGIDWMTRAELSQAIPPAYTEFIGRHILAALERAG